LLIGFDLNSVFSKTKMVLRAGELPLTLKPGQETKMLPGSATPTAAVTLWDHQWKNVHRGASKSTSTDTLCQQKNYWEGLMVPKQRASLQDFKIFIGLQRGDGYANILINSIYYWQCQCTIPKRGHSLPANTGVQGVVFVVSSLLGDPIQLPSTIFVCRLLNGHWL